MKCSVRTAAAGIVASLALAGCEDRAVETADRWTDESLPANLPVPLPWYTQQQVAAGKRLYRSRCAECHGENAEGAPNWRGVGPDGTRPPPPLNGTAHAWRHPLTELRAVFMSIDHGGEGVTVPRKNSFSDEEALAIIAWLQSLWPREIYAKWHYERHRDRWH